ncbi:MAG: hypothetical protein RLZZ618_1194 [Pseudomonadota bacterium]|jgi:cholesterol oxidase
MTETRRAFGQRVLSTAAALGLNTVTAAGITGRTVALGGLATAVAQSSQAAAASRERVRALVVGTGYGGAVAALRLAEKGIPVTMLEMGKLWNQPGSDGKIFCSNEHPDERAMWFSTKAAAVVTSFGGQPVNRTVPYGAGVLALKSFPGMDVYLGRGVGGGSLVNMAMLITPLREVLSEVMPSGFAVDDFLLRHYPKARTKLKSNTIRAAYFESSPYHQYARTLRANLSKAGFTTDLLPSGYDYAYMEKEEAGTVPKSALGNEGGFGNNHGKSSLDKNYIADAVGTGKVTIRAMTSVKKITRALDRTYVVTVEEIDLVGNILRRYEIACDHLFLAGGSVGTTEMLVRARQTGTLPRLNSAIGTKWSANGDIFVCRTNTPENPVGLQQSIVPASGFRTRDQNNKPLFSMNLPLPFPFESGISMSIVMPRNPETGSFSYNASTDSAVLNWTTQNTPAVNSAKFIFDKVNSANGTQYRNDLFSGKVFSDAATYHPVGGCPLGKATDLYGRVLGYDKLYIIDGSLIPGALAANPALTVAALAERNMENILSRDF